MVPVFDGSMATAVKDAPGHQARLLAWFAVRSPASARAARLVVATLAASAVVLGWIGFSLLGRNLSPLTILYGDAAMFVLAGTDVAEVPLSLEIARLLAPLATAGATLSVLMSLGRQRISWIAARKAERHLILLGPIERVTDYCASNWRPVVHNDPAGGASVEGAVELACPIDDDRWMDAVAVRSAARVVVALGNDEAALRLIGALGRLSAHPDLEITVEFDDRSTALGLAAAMLRQPEGSHIDVICRDDLSAESAADQVLAEISSSPDKSVSARRAAETTVVLVGDGPMLRLLGTHVGERLRRTYPGGGAAPRPRMWFVAADDDFRAELLTTLVDPVNLDVQAYEHLAGLKITTDSVIAVVVHEDHGENIRVAVQFKYRYASAAVYVRSSSSSSASELGLGLRALTIGTAESSSSLSGPWMRAAEMWHEQSHSTRWAALSRAERVERAAEVRTLLRGLLERGWWLAPTEGVWDGEVVLPEETMVAVGDAEFIWRDFPWVLPRVGFSLFAPGGTRGLPTPGNVDVLSDELVDQLARGSHAAYQESLSKAPNPTGQDFPADVAWEELSNADRAQNIQQVRYAVMRLAAAGFGFVPLRTALNSPLQLDEALVEIMARGEHDRWARLRRAQGYRWGPKRCDGPDLRHPNLVGWEDLDEDARDKDRNPMRWIVKSLPEVGLQVVSPPTG